MVGAHRQGQGLGVGGTNVVVNVQAIGLAPNGEHFRPQFVKDFGGDVVGRAMGGIDDDFQAVQ